MEREKAKAVEPVVGAGTSARTGRRRPAAHALLALLASTSLMFAALPLHAANRAAGGDGTEAAQALLLPDGTTRLLDQPYGDSPRQRFDVYLPAQPFSSPDPLRKETETMPGRALVLMVHGGAWVAGDKTMPRVVDHKMRHWLEQGVAFASTDYRLLPEAPGPIEQARDVARALARLQQRASDWGSIPSASCWWAIRPARTWWGCSRPTRRWLTRWVPSPGSAACCSTVPRSTSKAR